MMTIHRPKISIFVDRTSRQWIVRDPDGEFWVVPSVANGWDLRQPYALNEDRDLEPVPGHYRYLLELPF